MVFFKLNRKVNLTEDIVIFITFKQLYTYYIYIYIKFKDIQYTKLNILIILFRFNTNIKDYQAFWNLLIKYLKSDEPSTRYFALNYIAGIKEKLSRLLNDQDIAALLFKSIYSISTSEKVN